MNSHIVGVNLPENNPDPDFLRQKLREFADDGFDAVEIALDVLPLIIAGRINDEYTDYFAGLLHEFGFRYSAHIGLGVDLRKQEHEQMARAVLLGSIQLCATLGLNPLVLHYEAQSRDRLTEERFVAGHVEACEFAAREGLTLCIENIEVEVIEPLVEFVRTVSRPNLRIALDTGHAFLASRYYHDDFLRWAKQVAPYLGHLHLNDNAGIFEELRLTDYTAHEGLSMRYRHTFGRGDIHLPPFWGSVPFGELFTCLGDYSGMYVCEYNTEWYRPFNKATCQRVRRAIQEAG